jgi:hypothetical protein
VFRTLMNACDRIKKFNSGGGGGGAVSPARVAGGIKKIRNCLVSGHVG